MCGYCFEGYYLSGWQNGNYDASRIDSEGLVLGEDGFVAMGWSNTPVVMKARPGSL